LLALAGLAALYIAYPGTRSAFHQMIIVTTVIGILASAAIYFLVRRLERAEDTKEEREREEALKAVEEATRQLTLIRTYAMCGVGETQKAPTSIKLVWTGIKRKVCRAYI
jgi:type II secretory pathway pseudopilin PulG